MKNKYLRLFLLLTTIILSNNTFFSQSSDSRDYSPKILPPSPDAFKFASYGNVPIGLFTGSPNIQIPITTFQSGNISVPIGVNYSSNGIKVDDLNGSVGLGWNLMAGGVISRVIRDKPDETNTMDFTVPNISSLGFANAEVLNYLGNLSETFDTEPDLYTANFLGHSLKFVFKGSEIVQLDKSDFKIVGTSGGNGFTISDTNGTTYFFNETERTRNSTSGAGMHGNVYINTTSWYLTEVSNLKNEKVFFKYYSNNYTYTLSKSQIFNYVTISGQTKYTAPTSQPSIACPEMCSVTYFQLPIGVSNPISNDQNVLGRQIEKIYDSNNNYIYFTYISQNQDTNLLSQVDKFSQSNLIESYTMTYGFENNNRTFLLDIKNNKNQSSHRFEYFNKNLLPARLTFARDMWGYYNGITTNNNYVPQIFDDEDIERPNYSGANQNVIENIGYYGLLNKIIYPTGGSTELLYENHKVKKQKTIYPNSSDIIEYLEAKTTDVPPRSITNNLTVVFDNNQIIQILGGASFNTYSSDCMNSNYYPGDFHYKGQLKVLDDLTGNKLIFYQYGIGGVLVPIQDTSGNLPFNQNVHYYVKVKKNQKVNFILSAGYTCTYVGLSIRFKKKGIPVTYIADEPLGGYRIKTTVDVPITGTPLTKNYNYSDAIQLTTPYFLENSYYHSICPILTCQPEMKTSSYKTITSNNIRQSYALHPNIYYSTVTEEISSKGKTIHLFNTDPDYFGNPIKGNMIEYAPWYNFGGLIGREKTTIYKDESDVILKQVENNYIEDNSRNSIVYGLSVRKNYTPIVTYNPPNFDEYDFVQYHNISRFAYLQSQTTTDYVNGSPLLTSIEYFYTNPSHYQLTSQKTTFPDQSYKTTHYQYALEKGNTYLTGKNMIGIPLETQATKTANGVTKTISRTETVYPANQTDANDTTSGLPLPKSVSSLDLVTGNMSNEITYDQYDSYGNLQQYTTKSGVSTAIVWGYNNTQPIAKIEGAKYSQVSPYISNIVPQSDTDSTNGTPSSEQDLVDALDLFRQKSELSGFQITTYSYDPLVGVKSITPPNGLRQVYIYDTASRLMEVREHSQTGNLLKEYHYNYKH